MTAGTLVIQKVRSLLMVLASLIIGLLLSEGAVRMFWQNPYLDVKNSLKIDFAFKRQYLPNKNLVFNISGLYEGAKKSLFRTGRQGEVLGKNQSRSPTVLFFGGSTTESRYVNEGSRWPELVSGIRAVNVGYSGNGLGDSYNNLHYWLEYMDVAPEEVFIMHAVNDISLRALYIEAYDSKSGIFDQNHWSMFRQRTDKPRETLVVSPWVKRSSILALLFYSGQNWLAEESDLKVLSSYIKSAQRNRKEQSISEQEFRLHYDKDITFALEAREKVFSSMVLLAKSRGSKVTLLTQPHAYTSRYSHFTDEDIREYPIYYGESPKNFTLQQTAYLMSKYNEQTRLMAVELGVELIDLARGFELYPPGELLYDSIHMTDQGSKLAAKIINEHRKQ